MAPQLQPLLKHRPNVDSSWQSSMKSMGALFITHGHQCIELESTWAHVREAMCKKKALMQLCWCLQTHADTEVDVLVLAILHLCLVVIFSFCTALVCQFLYISAGVAFLGL